MSKTFQPHIPGVTINNKRLNKTLTHTISFNVSIFTSSGGCSVVTLCESSCVRYNIGHSGLVLNYGTNRLENKYN